MTEFRAKSLENKKNAAALYKAAPEAIKAFSELMISVSKDGALSARHKELMAIAISIVMRCEGCIIHHVDAAIRHGAKRDELVEAITVAIEMGGGPATVYGATALAVFVGMQSQ
jgi:AhpD family alkylhydroperoxidase